MREGSSQGPSKNVICNANSTTCKHFARWHLDRFDYKVIVWLGILYTIIVVASIIYFINRTDYGQGIAAFVWIVASTIMSVLIFGLSYLIRRFIGYIIYGYFSNIPKKQHCGTFA